MQSETIEMQGEIIQSLSNGMFRVRLDNGFIILGHISGKIRKNFIRILLGDKVVVEVSPYNLNRGRIIKRYSAGCKIIVINKMAAFARNRYLTLLRVVTVGLGKFYNFTKLKTSA